MEILGDALTVFGQELKPLAIIPRASRLMSQQPGLWRRATLESLMCVKKTAFN